MHTITPDPASKFLRLRMTDEDTKLALQVSPLFLAYLQNKIEAYASAVVESDLPYAPNPKDQVAAILAHERLKDFVKAYQELLFEIIDAQSIQTQE